MEEHHHPTVLIIPSNGNSIHHVEFIFKKKPIQYWSEPFVSVTLCVPENVLLLNFYSANLDMFFKLYEVKKRYQKYQGFASFSITNCLSNFISLDKNKGATTENNLTVLDLFTLWGKLLFLERLHFSFMSTKIQKTYF